MTTHRLMKAPLRRIKKAERYSGHYGCNIGACSVRLVLECGHETYRKGSKQPHFRARCDECLTRAKEGLRASAARAVYER